MKPDSNEFYPQACSLKYVAYCANVLLCLELQISQENQFVECPLLSLHCQDLKRNGTKSAEIMIFHNIFYLIRSSVMLMTDHECNKSNGF